MNNEYLKAIIENSSAKEELKLLAEIALRLPGRDTGIKTENPVEKESRLEEGKLYRTKDGRKAFVSHRYPYGEFSGIIIGDDHTTGWDKNGEAHYSSMKTDNLIAEWKD